MNKQGTLFNTYIPKRSECRDAVGLPYVGSKRDIAYDLMRKIRMTCPNATTFIDLFGGGGAMTLMALKFGYKQVIYNELNTDVANLFQFCCTHTIPEDWKEWVTREQFFETIEKHDVKSTMIRLCWSFGNLGCNYLFSQEIEHWKQAFYYLVHRGDSSYFNNMGIPITDKECLFKNFEAAKKQYVRWYIEHTYHRQTTIEELKSSLKNTKEELRLYLVNALKASGLSAVEVGRKLGTEMYRHYFGKSQWEFPTFEAYEKLKKIIPLAKDYFELVSPLQCFRLPSLERLERLQSLQRLERLQSLQSLESLQRLERLQSLQSLESLQRLERLQTYTVDYQDIELSDKDGVIYCDIPYKDTKGYGVAFDYERFYDWAERQTLPVYISEYWMPPDRFQVVAEFDKMERLNSKGCQRCVERVFRPRRQIGKSYSYITQGRLC